MDDPHERVWEGQNSDTHARNGQGSASSLNPLDNLIESAQVCYAQPRRRAPNYVERGCDGGCCKSADDRRRYGQRHKPRDEVIKLSEQTACIDGVLDEIDHREHWSQKLRKSFDMCLTTQRSSGAARPARGVPGNRWHLAYSRKAVDDHLVRPRRSGDGFSMELSNQAGDCHGHRDRSPTIRCSQFPCGLSRRRLGESGDVVSHQHPAGVGCRPIPNPADHARSALRQRLDYRRHRRQPSM